MTGVIRLPAAGLAEQMDDVGATKPDAGQQNRGAGTDDELIAALDLAVLADDRGYFPPYDAVAVARTATLLRRPEVRQALEALGGQVSAAEMRTMNRAVDVDHRDAAEVVRQFLKSR